MKQKATNKTHKQNQDNQKILLELFGKRSSEVKPGLERVKLAFQHLNMSSYPQKNILIAGTNGKGSTAGILWRLLASQGLRVGLFSSPHLIHFSERIQCSHVPINEHKIIKSFKTLRSQIPESLYQNLSFFEITTLLSLFIFNKEECDFNILEVGLGGRLDACNIVQPLVTAVTSIDKDHEEYLGSDLAKIAYEKLGITRPQTPLFWGERFSKEKGLEQLVRDHCTNNHIPLSFRNIDFKIKTDSTFELKKGETRTIYEFPKWIQNNSRVLKENFVLAYSIYHNLGISSKSHRPLSLKIDPIRDFESSDFPWPHTLIGRFQPIEIHATSIKKGFVDVCHNPASAEEFAKTLKIHLTQMNLDKIPGFISILADKDIATILDIFESVLHPMILFKANSPRSLKTSSLPNKYQKNHLFHSFSEAWNSHKGLIHEDHLFAICGSFFAIGDALQSFSINLEENSFQRILKGVDIPEQS